MEVAWRDLECLQQQGALACVLDEKSRELGVVVSHHPAWPKPLFDLLTLGNPNDHVPPERLHTDALVRLAVGLDALDLNAHQVCLFHVSFFTPNCLEVVARSDAGCISSFSTCVLVLHQLPSLPHLAHHIKGLIQFGDICGIIPASGGRSSCSMLRGRNTCPTREIALYWFQYISTPPHNVNIACCLFLKQYLDVRMR